MIARVRPLLAAPLCLVVTLGGAAPVVASERSADSSSMVVAPTLAAPAAVAPVITPSATVANPRTRIKVPGATEVHYFKVHGTSPNALLDSTVAKAEKWCHSSSTLACTSNRWIVRWSTRTNPSTGACKVTTARVSLTSTVQMPRWTKPARAPKALVRWWRLMLEHFAWHEGKHIKIQKKYDREMVDRLVGKACGKARTVVRKVERELAAAQAAFDRKDASWRYPPYPG